MRRGSATFALPASARRVCSRSLLPQVNKPYLPLASGDFSFALGQTLVVLCGAIALALGAHVTRLSVFALPEPELLV